MPITPVNRYCTSLLNPRLLVFKGSFCTEIFCKIYCYPLSKLGMMLQSAKDRTQLPRFVHDAEIEINDCRAGRRRLLLKGLQKLDWTSKESVFICF